ncbi:hypothetical protein EW146_g2248 [Bondarzewia mesenterica]|uniref:Aminoglycoside phosphotransferase domain-containing protein n=1 Tax=Bondarzewia mesenterica TaxID=1095465 RepID=A0A4S4M2Q2_9AGAM|nr:hypothetical protein EW146_g2248 [Bondarzewia mesenterica]
MLRVHNLYTLLWSGWLHFPSSVRTLAYKVLRWIALKLRTRESVNVIRLPFNLYAKYGRTVLRTEAFAMQYVAQHTTIPVPTILDLVEDNGGVFILMSRLPGQPLGITRDLNTMPSPQVLLFEIAMRDWLDQLRSLSPPNPDVVSGFDGGPCMSDRIKQEEFVGPFPSQREFHQYLYHTVGKRHHNALRVIAAQSHGVPHRICFESDIHPNNILVSRDGHLTGLIDWECAGWYPKYWEYTKTIYLRAGYAEWSAVFQRIFPQYENELMVEKAFWGVHNPW